MKANDPYALVTSRHSGGVRLQRASRAARRADEVFE
jgi:hypothetical protein